MKSALRRSNAEELRRTRRRREAMATIERAGGLPWNFAIRASEMVDTSARECNSFFSGMLASVTRCFQLDWRGGSVRSVAAHACRVKSAGSQINVSRIKNAVRTLWGNIHSIIQHEEVPQVVSKESDPPRLSAKLCLCANMCLWWEGAWRRDYR
eukprot:6970907-Pyramimonas_sp.AAC.1